MKTIALILLAVVAIAAVVLSWLQADLRHQTEAALADIAGKHAAVTAEIEHTEQRATETERANAGLLSALQELQAKSKATATSPAGNAPFNPLEAIMQDPRLQNAFLGSQRASLTRTYGPLFRQLGLNPVQTGKMQDILIKREEQTMDLQAVAQAQHLAPNDPTLVSLRKQAEDDLQAAATDLLGPIGAQQFQDYERTVGVRTVVQNLAGAAVLESVPLTPQQAEQVAQALAGASASFQGGGKASFENINWEIADAQLKPILSESQYALYRQIEPMGGGPSRFGSVLGSTFAHALRADQKKPTSDGD